jgi:2-dehydropantoate 2-reductase
MRLVILGAGAIGGVVGGLLARAKREVVLIARGAHLAAMQANGLRVEVPEGSFVVHPPVVDRVTDWRADDVVLLAVKTQDAASALHQLAAPPHVPIVCLTNGVEAERIALRHAREVYGGYVMVPASHLEPGVVALWAAPAIGAIDLGRYPDGVGERADEIAGELLVAGFASEVRTAIMRWKRGKLLSNLGNGAEALCGPPARRCELDDRARREGRAVFAEAGLSCTTEAEDAGRRSVFDYQPIGGAWRPGGSTWQSLARGTALEVEYLNGEIVMLGRLHGVPTPVNEALLGVVTEAARTGIAPGSLSLDELTARVDRYIAASTVAGSLGSTS